MKELFKKELGIFSIIAITIVGFAVIGTGGYFLNQKLTNTGEPSSSDFSVKRILKVESEPVGVTMTGDENCKTDSEKVAPYSCEFSEKSKETSIIAPEEFEKDGQSYSFSKWEDCSELSENKLICKVINKKSSANKIKAIYSKKETPKTIQKPATEKPNPCLSPAIDPWLTSCTISIDQVPKDVYFNFVFDDPPIAFLETSSPLIQSEEFKKEYQMSNAFCNFPQDCVIDVEKYGKNANAHFKVLKPTDVTVKIRLNLSTATCDYVNPFNNPNCKPETTIYKKYRFDKFSSSLWSDKPYALTANYKKTCEFEMTSEDMQNQNYISPDKCSGAEAQ